MSRSNSRRAVFSLLIVGLVITSPICVNTVQAVGVLYGDPGWLHAFDGNSAYYHDPDGPHPDYVNGGNTNEPGGKGGQPALIDIGPCGSDAECAAAAIWQNRGSEWEGSAPGAPLGGAPNPFGQFTPPVPAPAPGGVGTFSEGSTSFLRIQDPGLPNPYGWADKNAQIGPTTPKQEGNNRRIEFVHEMNRDTGFSGTDGILDVGVTLAFRARISTAATGPLDMIYPENGPNPLPWPTDGVGYPIANNGRGMIMISQGQIGGATQPGRVAFSLLDDNIVASTQGGSQPIVITKRGLAMNNRSNPGNSPDSNVATDLTANVVEIDNAELQLWQEFWITIQALPAPVAGNTHEVKVYMNGSLEAETFQIILGNQNEAGNGSYLGFGLTSGSRYGAFDLDYIAYKEGVHLPVLPPPMGLAGDYNDDGQVDAADYVVWRKNNNTNNPLVNDDGLGIPIGPSHYSLWRTHFGEASGSGSSVSAVPEPSTGMVVVIAQLLAICFLRNHRASAIRVRCNDQT